MAKIGIDRLYYAEVISDTDSTLTFGEVKQLEGVRELTINPRTNSSKLYAENQIFYSDSTLDGIEVGIDLADVETADVAKILGHEISSQGGIIKKATDNAPYVALLYRAQKANKADRYGILYKGKFDLPQENNKTMEGTVDYKTFEMQANFLPTRNNKMWQYYVDSDSATAPVDIETTFFSSVTIPTLPEPPIGG